MTFPKLLLLVWISASISATSAFECDEFPHCFCTESIFKCPNGNFEQMPIVFAWTTTFELPHNRIATLRRNHFSHLSLLEILDLSHNRIENLPSLVFSGLGNLRVLRLNSNRIEKIEPKALRNLHELKTLDLSDNPIKVVDSNAFSELYKLEQFIVFPPCSTPLSCEILEAQWNIQRNLSELCAKIPETDHCTPEIDNEIQDSSEIFKIGDSSPVFLSTPEEYVRVEAGSLVNLTCEASGIPLPEVTWLRNGAQFYQGSHLELKSLDEDLTLECVASNRAGIAAKEVQILVHAKKNFEMSIENLNGKEFPLNASRQVELSNNMTVFMDLYRNLTRLSASGFEFQVDSTVVRPDWIVAGVDMILSNFTGCIGGSQTRVPDCSAYAHFRSITGFCNNFQKPSWGSAPIAFRRLLRAKYEDNFVKPIGWFRERLYNGFPKPSSRLLSQNLLTAKSFQLDKKHNHMLMQFGQFLDHDLTFTSMSRQWSFVEDSRIDCRSACGSQAREPCYSMQRDSTSGPNLADPCIEVIRSTEVCGTGYTSPMVGKLVAREQANVLTAFIDGSQIYGSNEILARHLRRGISGLMDVTTVGNRTFLPISDDRHPIDCQMRPRESFQDCHLTGDHRANEQLGLLVMHNLFLREHNRIATELQRINPTWNDERLYQQARRIVGAQMQKITFEDWLPSIIGREGMRTLGRYSGYNSSVDATISNVFATAAMRFGHTMISPKLVKRKIFGKLQLLRNFFFASHLLYTPEMTKTILLGLIELPLKQVDPHRPISSELTQHLFEGSRVRPLDLAALNIQRGRDHALPEYNDWREFCGMKRAESFEDFTEIRHPDLRDRLRELYGHVNNVDLFVGAILESVATRDAKVGPTFRCLLIEQFRRLRDGDRFFYENPNTFTRAERRELKKGGLARIICDNEDGVVSLPEKIFEHRARQRACSAFERIDLNVFI